MRITIPLIVVFIVASALQAKVQVQPLPEGAIHPQSVVDEQGTIHLIYLQAGERRDGNIYYVRSQDGGAEWSNPIQVNSQPGSAYADSVRGPHLAIGRQGRVHVAWMGSREARPQAPDGSRPMLYARMNDRGNGFERQRNVIQQRPGLDGGGSIAADGQGNVYIAWHAPGTTGSHDEQDRGVWITRSRDDGRTFGAESQGHLDGTGVCACCSLRLFAPGDGQLMLFYRTAVERTGRDALLLVSEDAGESFRPVLRHPWQIGQCPMSTFQLTRWGDQILAGWETQGQVHFTRIDPTDLTYADPASAPGSPQSRKHPVMAVNAGGEMLLAWIDRRGWSRDGVLRWQVYDAAGEALSDQRGRLEGVSNFTVLTVFATPDGGFTIFY